MNTLSLYTPDYAQDQHSPWSPSAAEAWIKCPLYPLANYGRESASSAAAERGTDLHEIAANCILDPKLTAVPEDVEAYVDYCRSLISITSVWGVEAPRHLDDIPDVFGTCDFYARYAKVLEVVDLKTGYVPVSPESAQGKIYLLMMAYGDEEILRFTIVQNGVVKTKDYTPGELRSWLWDTLKPAYDRSLQTKPKASPSVKACQFCAGKGDCKAYAGLMTKEASLAFAPVVPKPEVMTPEQIAQIVEMAPAVKAWLEAVEAAGKNLIETGQKLPGFKLVEGRKSRAWADEDAAEDYACRHGIDPYVKKFMSPAQLEKAMKPHKKELQEFIVTRPGKPTLVPEGDKRPAIATSAQLAFKDVENVKGE